METILKSKIRAGQSLYGSTAIKTAILTLDGSAEAESASDAVVRRVGDEYPMLLAPIGAPSMDAETGETLRPIDFTALRADGTYFIDIPGVGRSAPFEISAESTGESL